VVEQEWLEMLKLLVIQVELLVVQAVVQVKIQVLLLQLKEEQAILHQLVLLKVLMEVDKTIHLINQDQVEVAVQQLQVLLLQEMEQVDQEEQVLQQVF
jgi:hypothetical protein